MTITKSLLILGLSLFLVHCKPNNGTAGLEATGTTTTGRPAASIICTANTLCAGGQGWLNPGQGGCLSGSPGWKGNGCTCTCSTIGTVVVLPPGTTSTVISPVAPVGPVDTAGTTGTAQISGGNLTCNGNKYCAGGWGWLNIGEAGCASGSPGWKGNGCSCTCDSATGATTTIAGGATGTTPTIAGGATGTITCNGNKYCSGGWGWLNAGESGCSAGSAGWKGNGCSCSCSSGGTTAAQPSNSGGYPSCPGNKFCSGGWGWQNAGEAGCFSGSAGWKGNGCSCTCN